MRFIHSPAAVDVGYQNCCAMIGLRTGTRCLFQKGERIRVGIACRALQQFQQRRHLLSDNVLHRVSVLVGRHDELLDQIMKYNETGDSNTAASLGKELSTLAPVASFQEQLESLNDEEVSFRDLQAEAEAASDNAMQAECNEEIERIKQERATIEQKLVDAVLPKDPEDGSNAILEIRAGTGGDEAALFAGELLDAYLKTAKDAGLASEVLNITKTDLGGIKEAAISISSSSYGSSYGGDSSANLGPYGLFKYESGVHRVQRVPVNDVRIHTSACSVAVLASPPEDSTIDKGSLLPMAELKIETMRASGAGGQHVNTTESAVRITHIPTGVTASIQDERSQHKNKAKALKLLTARVREKQREEEARLRGEEKSSLMGGGDRSERIRTYNFPQDRVTDHRCKESEYGITKLLSGGEDDGLVNVFGPYMRDLHREELMAQLEDAKTET